MQTHAHQEHLVLARAKFTPVVRALDRLAQNIRQEHGAAAVLEQRGPMQQTAQNAYAVRYALGHADEAQLSLTFYVVGEEADLILLQGQERSSPRDARADPGQVDQHVYRLERIEEIEKAVQEKVLAHLRSQLSMGRRRWRQGGQPAAGDRQPWGT